MAAGALPGAALAIVTLAACAPRPAPPPDLGPFEMPRVDLGTLPEVLRTRAEAAEKRAQDHPDDPSALGDFAFYLIEYDFPSAGASCLGRAERLAPGVARWPYYLGIALSKAGDRDGTIAAFQRAIDDDPSYPAAYVRLGDALLGADTMRAVDLYRKALALAPRSARAEYGLGRAAEASGDRKEAASRFEAAIRIAPGYADAHYALAMNLAAAGRSEEAQRELKLHAQGGAPPEDDDPLYAEMKSRVQTPYLVVQGEVARLTRRGKLDEAMSLVKKGIQTDVSRVTARKQMGEILGLQGHFKEAAAVYRQVLEIVPGDHEARTSLGQALEGMGDRAGAEKAYREVLDRHPAYAPAMVHLGHLLAQSGRATEGIPLLQRGVEERPAEGPFRYLLGVDLARAGRRDEALAELRKAAPLMPDHAGVRLTLGTLLLQSGDLEGAKDALDEAVRIAPDQAQAWILLARVALDRRDARSAVEMAEKGCRLSGFADPRQLAVLAAAYEAAGRKTDAAEIRRRAASAGKSRPPG